MAILIINPSQSYCGDCGNEANYEEVAHVSRLGYDQGDGKGCGAPFDSVGSDYMGPIGEVGAMRPDLPYVPCEEAQVKVRYRSEKIVPPTTRLSEAIVNAALVSMTAAVRLAAASGASKAEIDNAVRNGLRAL